MSNIILNAFYVAEPLLLVLAIYALLRSRDRRRFPALFFYFSLRLVSFIALYILLHIGELFSISSGAAYLWYFYPYWISYLVSAIAIFFVLQELFKFALEPLPGLKRLGSIAFRWVACLSFIAALGAIIIPGARGYHLLVGVVDQLMRCDSIFILSLLLFLMLTAKSLGISYRSRLFGVSFGFGIIAASNLVATALFEHFSQSIIVTSTLSLVDTGTTLVSLLVWSVYLIQREPVRRPVTLPVTSPLVRWNEIAIALGHSGSRAPATAPPSDFFLQDVEKVVDRILVKNSLNAAS